MAFTDKQEAFISEYIDTLDPLKSVIKAGYSPNDAKRRANELLQNPRIIKALHDKIAAMPRTLRVNRAFILKKLLEIVEATSQCEEILDKNGTPTGNTKLKDASVALRALDALTRCCVSGQNSGNENDSGVRVLCIENLDDGKI